MTTDEGKVLFKNEETRDSSDLGGKSGGYGYTASIPLKDIPPGRYVLKVEAKSRLGQTPPATRKRGSKSGRRDRTARWHFRIQSSEFRLIAGGFVISWFRG